ncbi:uncharacterized protein METZ01_LOCUS456182, partial [marine metagenome]
LFATSKLADPERWVPSCKLPFQKSQQGI